MPGLRRRETASATPPGSLRAEIVAERLGALYARCRNPAGRDCSWCSGKRAELETEPIEVYADQLPADRRTPGVSWYRLDLDDTLTPLPEPEWQRGCSCNIGRPDGRRCLPNRCKLDELGGL